MSDKVISVSRPSFAELVAAIGPSQVAGLLDDQGRVVLGEFTIESVAATDPAPGPCARAATRLLESAQSNDGLIYQEGNVRVMRSCKPDGMHLMRVNDVDGTCLTTILPRASLALVAAECIACMESDPQPVNAIDRLPVS